jgi:hypothetical protein
MEVQRSDEATRQECQDLLATTRSEARVKEGFFTRQEHGSADTLILNFQLPKPRANKFLLF